MKTTVQRTALSWIPTAIMTAIGVTALASQHVAAQSPSTVASTLQSRYWWADLGSQPNRPFGVMYMFGTQPSAMGSGWYVGTRVSFHGMFSTGVRTGFAWRPIQNGVIIDRGSSQEVIMFIGSNAAMEVVYLSGTFPNQWSTTRSPYTPAIIRQYYYR